ncbi:NAD-dependent epimerase/dehydratase family protein [Fulvivirga sedimenti]|uniref:NAD-dependent epimerase/dehydratase family protein n=1 Tax=Fulvivirga sedimenti TaxID=2879465 RepID=A0A9X1KYM7_9BACT|nr:NAD-dependent epimerase/dehydratase family protein [Fulvivirga sedimenti]MCA6073771.1 NAD-dependent epimerase/dehydratase family protein [Fulvivirga sedimenti]
MKKVGIIGGAGFIGSYNTKKFLEEGYQVKVSVTDLSKPEKYEHLLQLPHAENLEIVELDVTNTGQLGPFLQGCQIVIHGGTPFQLDVQDPQSELFDPTIKGTENFLAAVQQTPGIEKVVFIASVAAHNTNFPLLPDGKNEGDVISEEDTLFMSEEGHPYAQAKFIANQTVEKFIRENPDLSFEIVTVCPVGVMGNALSARQDSTSMGIQFLFKNKIAPNPFFQMFYDNDIYFALVDVADVAEGVYKAAILNGLHGKKYLLSSESYRVSDIHRILNDQEPVIGPAIVYSNALAKQDLGMEFKPASVPLHEFAG